MCIDGSKTLLLNFKAAVQLLIDIKQEMRRRLNLCLEQIKIFLEEAFGHEYDYAVYDGNILDRSKFYYWFYDKNWKQYCMYFRFDYPDPYVGIRIRSDITEKDCYPKPKKLHNFQWYDDTDYPCGYTWLTKFPFSNYMYLNFDDHGDNPALEEIKLLLANILTEINYRHIDIM